MRIMNKRMGWNFLGLAFCAFGGLGLEFIYAFVLEPLVFGAQMGSWSTAESIVHWTLTGATFGAVSAWLVWSAGKNYGLDILSAREKVGTRQWAAVAALIAVSILMQYQDWGGFKTVLELERLGTAKFVFQYLYYGFETLLFLMIIVFGQKACELWLGHEKIPYGGIICGLTWGLGHILSKGGLLIGLQGLLWGVMFGAAYLLVNRDIRKAWPVLFLMFVL